MITCVSCVLLLIKSWTYTSIFFTYETRAGKTGLRDDQFTTRGEPQLI